MCKEIRDVIGQSREELEAIPGDYMAIGIEDVLAVRSSNSNKRNKGMGVRKRSQASLERNVEATERKIALKLKRVYEAREADDGARILVDRLWPRGLRSAEAGISEWAKEIALSDELRRWFGHSPERWPAFKQRYMEELSNPEKTEQLKRIARIATRGNVTLVCGAKDIEHNNARVLEELIARYMTDLVGAS